MTMMHHALLPRAIAQCLEATRPRFLTCLLGWLLIAPSLGFGEPAVIDRSVKVQSGKDTRVAVFTSIRSDCTPGKLPTIRLKLAPTRGKITIRNAKFRATNLKQCLAIEAPAYVAIYRADSDFSGNDIVELEIVEANGKQKIERLTITIGKSSRGEDI